MPGPVCRGKRTTCESQVSPFPAGPGGWMELGSSGLVASILTNLAFLLAPLRLSIQRVSELNFFLASLFVQFLFTVTLPYSS